jgi:hypothetical protein
VAKSVAQLLATACSSLGSNSDISQNKKWSTEAKEWPTLSTPPKNIYTKTIAVICVDYTTKKVEKSRAIFRNGLACSGMELSDYPIC